MILGRPGAPVERLLSGENVRYTITAYYSGLRNRLDRDVQADSRLDPIDPPLIRSAGSRPVVQNGSMGAPWDRLPDETAEAYARFLLYRNLGPARSHIRAYRQYLQRTDGYRGGVKGLTVPGSWRRESVVHRWPERAAAWDVRNLRAYGARVAALHVRTVVTLAAKNARHARRLNPGDDGWADLLASVRVVAAVLTPELVRDATTEFSRPAADPAPADDGVG